MKNIKLVVAAATICLFPLSKALAQSDNDMTSAILLFNKSVDLDKAKISIDKAIAKNKINDRPKVWRYKAEIYEKMYRVIYDPKAPADEKARYRALMSDTGAIAATNAAKIAEALRPSNDDEHYKAVKFLLTSNLPIHLANEGSTYYGEKKYSSAYMQFNALSDLVPKDTNAILNGTITAVQLDDVAKVQKQMEKARKAGYPKVNKSQYETGLRYLQSKPSEASAYDALLAEARKAYPSEKSFINLEINGALVKGDLVNARKSLVDGIAADPNNKELYYFLANTYEQESAVKGKPLKEVKALQANAIENYNKCLAFDSTYYDANYNLGVVYLAIGNLYIDSLNNLPLKASAGQTNRINSGIKKAYLSAQKYFDRCHRLKPKEIGTMNILLKISGILKDEKRFMQIDAEIKAAGGK